MVLKLDLGQISFSQVENAFVTRQLALLVSKITFYKLWARACAEIKILRPTSLGFSIFEFFSPSLFSFLFAAGIDLLLGLLAVKNLLRKSHRGGQFLPWSS